MSRISETEIADIVETILLERPTGEATVAELVDEIPNRVVLSADDLAPSPTHLAQGVPRQCHHDGRLLSVPGGLRLANRAALA